MIEFDDVLKIHSILIDQFGGVEGVRDVGLLDSALKRPYQTFDGEELYKTTSEKAAAILESIVKNHPFIDGNKRTGYVLCRLILLNDKMDFTADLESKYELIIQVSTGNIDYVGIKEWITVNTRVLP